MFSAGYLLKWQSAELELKEIKTVGCTKQRSAITGPYYLVPYENRYYITGIAWAITLSVCRLFHSDDDQTDRKRLDS